MLTLIHAPNPVLAEIAKPITKIDKTILRLIEEMKETLLAARDPEGVGLAAPQVGKSLQLFIVKPTRQSPITAYINPVLHFMGNILITRKRKSKDKKGRTLEGCLSLPNIWGEVLRHKIVHMEYMDESGKTHRKLFKGFAAIIMQHEYDHIQGILFPKRVLEQNGKLYKSHKNEKGEDEFEKISI